MLNQLKDFLDSSVRNQWLTDEFMQVYLRKSHRYYAGNLIQVLDIATIEVYPDFQRQGKCSEFLRITHQINPYQATFVENVLHEFLRLHLFKNQYLEYSIPNCFLKLVNLNEN
ncbi:hypothetical protein ACE1CD_15630 [Aerosakkonema sp. BLCC-F183]|uniref:hypothetical protein n=1 Tax=Aerosakkonema sp. BLCC-F183 TaxID=3342834 RepID=UPI0035B6E3CA